MSILSTVAYALTHALPSASLEAAVRVHFGLTQAELARYLGTSSARVADFEAGRRRASPPQSRRLAHLGRLLPPPEGTGPPAPACTTAHLPAAPSLPLPAFGPLPAAPLKKRQRQVLGQAARLRLWLHQRGKAEALQQRRQGGLAVLQAALPGPGADPAERARVAQWLATLAADVVAATPGPAGVAERALAVVRLLALDAEAAALAQLAGTAISAP